MERDQTSPASPPGSPGPELPGTDIPGADLPTAGEAEAGGEGLIDRLRGTGVGVEDPNIVGDAGPTDVAPGRDPDRRPDPPPA